MEPAEADVPKKPSILPQMLILFGVMASASAALNADSPLLPRMAVDQLGVAPSNVGFSVGVIQGSYSMAQFASSFVLGYASDRLGRKPIMVLGVFMCAICTAGFGLASSFFSAVLIRVTMGLTNSNTVLARASMADITMDLDAPKRSLAFAYLSACFSLARSISAALSGAMASVPHQWLLPSRPFFFPMAMASLPIFIMLLLVVVYLPETRPTTPPHKTSPSSPPHKTSPSFPPSSSSSSTPPPASPSFLTGLRAIYAHPSLLRVFLLSANHTFAAAGVLVVLVLFTAHPTSQLGLGLSAGGVGVVFWLFGTSAFVFQLTCFKHVVARLGLRRTYAWGGGMMVTACTLIPCSALPLYYAVPHARAYSWLLLGVGLCCCGAGFMTLAPCANVMMVNVTDPAIFGLTTGVGASIGALLRAFGPVTFGSLFSAAASNPLPVFALLGLFDGVLNLAMGLWGLPETLEGRKEDEEVRGGRGGDVSSVESGCNSSSSSSSSCNKDSSGSCSSSSSGGGGRKATENTPLLGQARR